MDGKTNSIKNKGVALDGNYVPNAVDHAVFNKVEYVASNLVNPWSWGTADNIYASTTLVPRERMVRITDIPGIFTAR